MKKLLFLTGSFLFISITFVSGQWQRTNGPGGGYVKCLAANSTTLFAGTSSGVFTSTNNGNSWSSANTGITNLTIQAIITAGTDVLVGTPIGIFKSTDNGVTWFPSNSGLSNFDVKSFTKNSQYLFVSTSTTVYRSSDNGNSWNYSFNGTWSGFDSMITNGSEIYGTDGFFSNDNGNNWSYSSSFPLLVYNNAFAILGSNIFTGTINGVYVTPLGTNNWTFITMGGDPTMKVTSLLVQGSRIFAGTNKAGIYASDDNGNTWTTFNNGLSSYYMNFLFEMGTDIFAGTNGGISKSANNGTNWFDINAGLHSYTSIYSLFVSEYYLYAGTGGVGSLYKTIDLGDSWEHDNNGLNGNIVYSILINDKGYFAGTNTGVYFKSNSGDPWNLVLSTTSDVYELASNDSVIIAGAFTEGIFTSADGINWTQNNNGLSFTYITDLSTMNSCFLASAWGGGNYISCDNGNSWSTINNGLPAGFSPTSIASDGSNILTCINYSGSQYGLFLSSDSGATWNDITNGLNYPYKIAFIDSLIIISTYSSGIFKSSDYGNTWVDISDGLMNGQAYHIAYSAGTLFAGTPYSVWKRPLSEVLSVGVPEITRSEFRLFPNPANSVLNLKLPACKSPVSVSILDLTGKIVVKQVFEGAGTREINISSLEAGTYIATVQSEMLFETRKFVIAE